MSDYVVLLPKAAIALTVVVALLLDSLSLGRRRTTGYFVLVGLLVVGLVIDLFLIGHGEIRFWHGALVVDRVSVFADMVLLALGALVLLAAAGGAAAGRDAGDFALLLTLSLLGASVLVSAGTLVVVFLAIELAIIPTFALVGFRAEDRRGLEAALKYFLLSVFASAVLFYGIALVYGSTGSVAVPLPGPAEGSPLLMLGISLVLVGFGFKLAAFPFHQWLPDAFDVAPAEVAAFLAVGPKIAAAVALVRILTGLEGLEGVWEVGVAAVAVMTMVWGNLAALRQEGLKRLLAYSAVAHAGYALVGVAAGSAQGMEGAVLYFAAYGAGAVGAFLVVGELERDGMDDRIAGFAGLSTTRPFLAGALAVCLISMIGVPLFAGFWGKFSVFLGAVEGGWTWLAVVGVLNSALSFGYYGNVIRIMYFDGATQAVGQSPAPGVAEVRTAGVPVAALREAGGSSLSATDAGSREGGTRWGLRAALGIAVVLTLLLGVVPGLLLGALG